LRSEFDRNRNVGAADSFAEILVFVFGIDDDDVSAEHEVAQAFEFDRVTLPAPEVAKMVQLGWPSPKRSKMTSDWL